MDLKENDSSIWTKIWDESEKNNFEEIKKKLDETKKSNDWISYTKLVQDKFGGWKNINSIEVGSGSGWHSFVAASEGANVTLLDYSESALEVAKERFEFFGFKANFIPGNAFEIIYSYNNKFNLSWSFGTIEHFKGNLRQLFFQLHFDFIQKNGITIISSPYKYALNYRLWMFYAQKYNQWNFGLEIPYSKSEFIKRLKLSQNELINIHFQEGRPCLYKLLAIFKKKSRLRYWIFYPIVRIIHKLNIKLKPFYFRNIILIALKK